MPLDDRFTVAGLAVAVAVPWGGFAALLRMITRPGGRQPALDGIDMLLWLTLLLLAFLWTYACGWWVTRGRMDEHVFSAAAVAAGTVAGMMGGVLVATPPLFVVPFALALVGGLAGTYVERPRPGAS